MPDPLPLHDAFSPPADQPTTHPEAQWFPHVGLGLFIHWSIACCRGGREMSWSMVKGKPNGDGKEGELLTPRDYWALTDGFDPGAYDPDPWLAAAAAAGFRYAVLTARHLDGYAMWPGEATTFGTRTHLGGRDLVRPFVDACRRHGLKVGLYYSPPHWHLDRDFMSFHYHKPGPAGGDSAEYRGGERFGGGIDHEERRLDDGPLPGRPYWSPDHVERVAAELHELLTGYGRIDLLWFDSGGGEVTAAWLRESQPHLVINSRLAPHTGDYLTPEGTLPAARPDAAWWEYCHSWAYAWGYTTPEKYRPAEECRRVYEQCRAWGGNYLPNVAPRPDGTLPQIAYDRLDAFAKL